MPKYDSNGKKIEYTITAESETGYEYYIRGDAENGFEIYCILETETVDIPVKKVWVDNENASAARPDSITVTLYIGNDPVVETEGSDGSDPVYVALTLGNENGWEDSFENLPRYDSNGEVIEYTVREDEVSGYRETVAENEDKGGYTITNTLVYPLDIFKYTTAVWTSTTDNGGGGATGTDTYYLRYEDTNGYWYATVSDTDATGLMLQDPIVVTGWVSEDDEDFTTKVWYAEVGASAQDAYYFTGLIGSENIYFETTSGPAEIPERDEPISLYKGSETTGQFGLRGAYFVLSKTEIDENTGAESTVYAEFTRDEETMVYTFVDWVSEDEYEKSISKIILISGTDGYIHIEGLEAGGYDLAEIGAPYGYDLPDERNTQVTVPYEAVGEEARTVEVENDPTPEPEAEILVHKELKGTEWTEDYAFSFSISADEGTPMPAETELTITADDASSDYTKAFNEIDYTMSGTYEYTITESKGEIEEIEYDENEIMVTVEVSLDEGTGEWSAIVSYGEEADAAVFTNTYTDPGAAPASFATLTEPLTLMTTGNMIKKENESAENLLVF